MKFSYNWIREFVEDLNQAPGPLERLITMKTAECEGIEAAGALLERACAARVVSVEPIPGSHNVKAVVDTGRYGEKTVVCGAPNCRPGVITAYAPIGKKVIHGVESDGMLASAAELGHQSRPRRHHRTRFAGRRPATRLPARQRHRDRQQVHHPPPRPVGPSRHGARSGRHPRAPS